MSTSARVVAPAVGRYDRPPEQKGNAMTKEPQSAPQAPPRPRHDESSNESLTDLIDRLDREAFLRLLELRHLRVQPHVQPRR